jgi:hypothetical protein
VPKPIIFFFDFKPVHGIKTEIAPPSMELVNAILQRGIHVRSVGKTIETVRNAPHRNNPFLDSIDIIPHEE